MTLPFSVTSLFVLLGVQVPTTTGGRVLVPWGLQIEGPFQGSHWVWRSALATSSLSQIYTVDNETIGKTMREIYFQYWALYDLSPWMNNSRVGAWTGMRYHRSTHDQETQSSELGFDIGAPITWEYVLNQRASIATDISLVFSSLHFSNPDIQWHISGRYNF